MAEEIDVEKLVENARNVAWMSLVVSIASLVGSAVIVSEVIFRAPSPAPSGTSLTDIQIGVYGIILAILLWGFERIFEFLKALREHHVDYLVILKTGVGLFFFGAAIYLVTLMV